jgi:hypothetical protein
VKNDMQDRSRPFSMPDIERRAMCNFDHIVLPLENNAHIVGAMVPANRA